MKKTTDRLLPKKSKQAGYSLLESVITIGILTALVGVSAPSFASLILKNELTTLSNTVLNSLSYARNHAVSQQQIVHLCQLESADDTSCSKDYGYNRDWSNGWLIFADVNRNNELDEEDHVLQHVQLDTSAKVIFNQRGRLRFFPEGGARSAGYYLCDKLGKEFRHVYLLYSGRARVNRTLSQKQRATCTKSFSN